MSKKRIPESEDGSIETVQSEGKIKRHGEKNKEQSLRTAAKNSSIRCNWSPRMRTKQRSSTAKKSGD